MNFKSVLLFLNLSMSQAIHRLRIYQMGRTPLNQRKLFLQNTIFPELHTNQHDNAGYQQTIMNLNLSFHQGNLVEVAFVKTIDRNLLVLYPLIPILEYKNLVYDYHYYGQNETQSIWVAHENIGLYNLSLIHI